MIKFFNPGSLCVDSLAFSWIGETCWLVPPVSLVKIVIRHVCYCPCRGILVIPYWPLAPFGPLLVQSGGVFKSFVVDFLYAKDGKYVYFHEENKNFLFGSENFGTPVFFLLLDGVRLGLFITAFTLENFWMQGTTRRKIRSVARSLVVECTC